MAHFRYCFHFNVSFYLKYKGKARGDDAGYIIFVSNASTRRPALKNHVFGLVEVIQLPITYIGVALPGSFVTVLLAKVTRKPIASGPFASLSLSP